MSAITVLKNKSRLPVTELMLLLVALFWGTSYGMTKEALVYTPVFVFIVIRFSCTFMVMLPLVIKDFKQGLNKDWKVALPTGIVLSLIFMCEVGGIYYTSASKAAVLISLSVLFTSALELLINKKKPSGLLVGLSVLSVIGVVLLSSEASNSDSLTTNFEISRGLNLGDYLILCAAVLRALMVTLTKKLVSNKQITTTSLTAFQSLVVAIVGCIALMFLNQDFNLAFIPLAPQFWGITAYLVLFCTLFAFFVQNYAVKKHSPTKVALLMGSEPLFGAMFAVIWLGESLSPIQIVGMGVIVVTVTLVSVRT